MPAQKTLGAKVAVIGGSGLYSLDDLKILGEVTPKTPWGKPSDAIVVGEISGVNVAFLPRHGRGHRLLPTEVPSRANIAALKSLGVESIVAFSAVGSLKEELKPQDFVIPNQIIDRTRLRPSTFFGDGVVGHVVFADPFSPPLADLVHRHAKRLGLSVHAGETLVCMEGPQFSTRAESHLYRSWGAGLINMSAIPESKLAREAQISYAMVCMVTDYDCWHEGHDDVDVAMVVENLGKNAENARRLVRAVVADAARLEDTSGAREAAKFAIMTARDKFSKPALARLRFLYPDQFGPARSPAARKPASRRGRRR